MIEKNILLNRIKQAVLSVEPSAEVVLFGSRVRNDFNESSDWDFLILVDGEVDVKRADRIRHVLYLLELDTDEIISSIVRNRQQWDDPKYSIVPLHENINREGIRL